MSTAHGLVQAKLGTRSMRLQRKAIRSDRERCNALHQALTLKPKRYPDVSVCSITNANFPVDNEGRTYHVGVKPGDVANLVLSVGPVDRAERISTFLDPPATGRKMFRNMSSRGFLTITGFYRGSRVSIISTHMGIANMDFVVREVRAVVEGPLCVVRFGTCGAVQPPAKLGDFIIATEGSVCIRTNPDAFAKESSEAPYTITSVVPSDPELSQALYTEAAKLVGSGNVVSGLNATADLFYSSQGRLLEQFEDRNEHLFAELLTKHPKAQSLEMETFQLLHLARCCRTDPIRGAAICIALAERYSNKFIDYAKVKRLEEIGGLAALNALVLTAQAGSFRQGQGEMFTFHHGA